MKKYAVFCLLLLFLTGCSGTSDPMEAGIGLRSRLLQATGCTFDAEITADYGDKIHIFSMKCKADANGSVTFTVAEPETISGISGILAEEQLSPVSAPWILLRTLRSGNMVAAWEESGAVWLSVDDSFASDALRLDVRLNETGLPEAADILYNGRRILSVAVANFEIL